MVKTSQKKRVHKKQANCFSVYVNSDQRRGKECCCVFFSTSCCENSIEVHIPTTAPRKRAAQHGNYQKGLMTMVLDVLTPLSDCRQESVEKMERRISGVSYLNWIWSSGTTFTAYCCFPGMSLQRVFVLWVFVCSVNLKSLFRLPRRGLLRPTDTLRLPRRGLPRPYRYIQANRLPRLQGYHARATTLHTNLWVQARYHTCG